MKKLMIAAAVLAVAGAQAACLDAPGTPDVAAPADVYVWQFTGKTSTAVLIKNTTSTGGGCVDVVTSTDACAIRIPGTLAITAYTYICDDECWQFDTLLANSPVQYLATKPWKSATYNTGSEWTINVAHVVGKAKNQYELEGTVKFPFTNASDLQEVFELTFAGFGVYDKKNGRMTSVNGNFAGTQTPPRYNGVVKVDAQTTLACPPADYWNCQTLDFARAPEDPSVAFGNWNVRYNATYSKKLAANGNWRVK